MLEQKLSSSLLDYLKANDETDVDVIIELSPFVLQGIDASLPRQQKIEQTRNTFNQALEPVEAAIRNGGGDILGAAWINQTVKARIPAKSVTDLANLASVSAIDLPHKLRRDAY